MLIHPNQTKSFEFNGHTVTCKSVPNLLVYHKNEKLKELDIKLWQTGYNAKLFKSLKEKMTVKIEGQSDIVDYTLLSDEEAKELVNQQECLLKESALLEMVAMVGLMYSIDSVNGIELKKEKIKDKLGLDREIVSLESIVELGEVHGFDLFLLSAEVEKHTSFTEDVKKK